MKLFKQEGLYVDFFSLLKDKYNINLNEQQKKAVTHIDGTALILAGPGSGKTTVITARAAYLILCYNVKPENILTLTFNKAAQLEMERRFTGIFGSIVTTKVHFATLHSFCNRIVRDYEKLKGQRLRRIEGNDEDFNKKQLLRDIYFDLNNSKISDDDLESLINEIGLVKNKMIKDFVDDTFSSKKYIKVYRAYEEYKKNKLMIDFDDMLTYAYSILIKCPEILNNYRKKYKYIQVDEGQDLSKIQFEILKLIFNNNSNFYIVADDDQSIYGFRGAEPQYILQMEKQYKDCSIYRLENNYRSSKNIVQLSSQFIRRNKQRYDKNHETDNGQDSDPVIIKPQDQRGQIDFIIKKIKQELSDCSANEIAILYRNNLSSILVADALERNHIRFKIRQNKLFFFNHWLVQDIVAFLMFTLDGRDIEAFSKIYYRMNRYVSKAMLECVQNSGENELVIDCIIKNSDLKQFQISTLNNLKQEFAVLAKNNPYTALEYIKNNFKYLDSVKEYCELTGQTFEYLNRLFGILQDLSANCPTITSFLIRLNELEQIFEGKKQEKPTKEKINITLSTLHSSKGLEYDSVFMIDLQNSEIPGDKALESVNKCALEEERRLFYVGMTRARRDLYLMSPAKINNEPVISSIFVSEVANLMQKDIIDGIGDGLIVEHVKFGKGVVIAVNENENEQQTIEIKFSGGVHKVLDLKICLNRKLINFNQQQ